MINLVERTMTRTTLEYEDFTVEADVIIEPIIVGAEGEFWGEPTHEEIVGYTFYGCLLYTSPSPRDRQKSRMPSSA